MCSIVFSMLLFLCWIYWYWNMVHKSTGSRDMLLSDVQETSRGIVMCAHDVHTLRLARTQISVLRALYSMNNTSFVVFHADEIDRKDAKMHAQIKSLTNTPGVKLESLTEWYRMAYGDNVDGLNEFRGYFCKVGALLAAPFDIVALIDLDVVLMSNPFSLMDTDIYRKHGHYLFRDLRTSITEETQKYTQQLREFWAHFHPDRPNNVSAALLNSPPFTGWSHFHGESALVLVDKGRNSVSMAVLEEMVGPHLMSRIKLYVLGDKESYWQAIALAGHEPGMNPYAWATVGHMDDKGQTCSYSYVLAQWVWLDGELPKVFYVNSDGIENLITGKEDTLFRSSISDPKDYYSPRTNIDNPCASGATSIPQNLLQTFHAYRLIYEQLDTQV